MGRGSQSSLVHAVCVAAKSRLLLQGTRLLPHALVKRIKNWGGWDMSLRRQKRYFGLGKFDAMMRYIYARLGMIMTQSVGTHNCGC
jgi:hypothetical protein